MENFEPVPLNTKAPRKMRAAAIKSLQLCAKQIDEMKQDETSWAMWEALSDNEDSTYTPRISR